jgi:NAD(P)-dependent dehydrogenase (short-subunit alcohol dehydrogenase family)
MYHDLKGKVALITGAGKRTGMGYAIADKLALCGCSVIIADLGKTDAAVVVGSGTADSMKSIVDDLHTRHGVETMALNLDVTDTGSVKAMAEAVKGRFGALDILCNNAGAAFGVPNAVITYSEAEWLRTVDVNLHGTFRVSKALAPLMSGRQASIINTASRAGKFPAMFNGAYAVAKAGVIMLTKVMAKELGGMGIRVNAICPAQIRTDLLTWQLDLEAKFLGGTVQDREKEMCASIPLGRVGTVEEMADLTAFLASEESRYITGQAINLCGGQLMEL